MGAARYCAPRSNPAHLGRTGSICDRACVSSRTTSSAVAPGLRRATICMFIELRCATLIGVQTSTRRNSGPVNPSGAMPDDVCDLVDRDRFADDLGSPPSVARQ